MWDLLMNYLCPRDFRRGEMEEKMNNENQNIEWKESWRDEYLKWICGMANAQGGKLYIGINDDGKITGISNAKRLMEDIPNKVRDTLGIIVDVNLLKKENLEYLEITVYPSSYPINYKGEYHYRSGRTKQLLKGNALTEFLVSRTGVKWDAVPVDNVSVDELDSESFEIFRKEALRSGRMTESDLAMNNAELLDSLGLITNGKLKRAAVLLFHRHPERWITGSYIKIGKFGKGSDLQYQDEVKGSLILQADRVIDLIYLKYLKATISYEHDIRIETYPFAREAVREAVYNAIIHKFYPALIPIQIRIEDDAMYISNDCVFPTGWTKETLMERHRSMPYNPDIANTFFRAGYVETWGRGIQKICEACHALGAPNPEYTIHPQDIMIKFDAVKTDHTNSKSDDLSDSIVLDDKQRNHIDQSILSSLSINQRFIYKTISENPGLRIPALSEISGLTKNAVEAAIRVLKNKELVEFIGTKRQGGYFIR